MVSVVGEISVDKYSDRGVGKDNFLDPEDGAPIALESRIAFDGAMAAEAMDQAVEVSLEAFSAEQGAAPSDDGLEAAVSDITGDGSSQIVFVDAGVENPADLLAAAPEGAEVVFIDADSDGVSQIAEALEGREGLDAIHILSHGEPGELILGSARLTSESTANSHADALSSIGAALSSDGDILIYGCDFAENSAALDLIAEATGADVAASDDTTGAAARGGDWELEVVSGDLDVEAISAEAWDGVLAPLTVDFADPGVDFSGTSTTYSNIDGSGADLTLSYDNSSGGVATTFESSGPPANGDTALFLLAGGRGIGPGENVPITIDVSANPADFVNFTLYHINNFGGAGDQVTIVATTDNGTTLTNPVMTPRAAPAVFSVTGNNANAIFGAGVSGERANLDVSFGQAQLPAGEKITSVTIFWTESTEGGGATSGQHGLGIGKISFDFTPGVTAIDLNSDPGETDTDRIFKEDGAAVTLVDAFADSVVDSDDNLSSLSIDVGGAQTGDILSIGGVQVPLDVSTVAPIPVTLASGEIANITYDVTTGELTVVEAPGGDGVISVADMTALIESAQFSNGDGDLQGDDRTFDFTLTDASGNVSNTARSTVEIDLLPGAEDAVFTLNEDQTIGRFLNIDPGDGPATITLDTDVTNGTLTLNQDGSFSYTPDPGFNGQDTFTYTVTDANGDTSTATVKLNVGLVAEEDKIIVDAAPGETGTVNVLENDTAAPRRGVLDWGDPTLFTDGAAPGEVVVEGVTFTPSVAVSDSDFPIAGSNFETNFAGRNGEPGLLILAANADGFNRDGFIDFTLDLSEPLGFGSIEIVDIDAALPSWQDRVTVTAENNGTPVDVQIVPRGTLTTVDGNQAFGISPTSSDGANVDVFFDGEITSLTIRYDYGDGATNFNNGGQLIGVGDFSWDIPNEITVTDLAGERDDNDDVITQFGTVDWNEDGTFNYTPDLTNPAVAALAAGEVLDETLTYETTDSFGNVTTQIVNFCIIGQNDAPEANPDIATTPEDTPLTVNAADGLLGNDVDVDGDDLTVTEFTVDGQTIAVDPTNGGVATIAGVGELTINADGSYSFTAAPDFNGAVPQVTYTVSDGTITDTSTLDITVTPVNDPPVADDETFDAEEDGGPIPIDILDGDIDPDGDTLTVSEVDGAPITPGIVNTIPLSDGSGTVVIDAAGNITFEPAPDFNGPAVFEYEVSDGNGGTDIGQVTVNVDPTPEAGDVSETTPEDTPVAVNPLENDDPAEVASVTITAADLPDPTTFGVFSYTDAGGNTIALDPANPDQTLTPAEAATIIFTPAPDFNGTVPPVGFVVEDLNGDTAPGTMNVIVTPVNDPPVANDDTFALEEDGSIILTPVGDGTAFDFEDGQNITITAIDGQAILPGGAVTLTSGTVSLDLDGVTLTFTPAPDFNGPASFDYTVTDSGGLTDTGTLSGIVDPNPEDDAITGTTPEDSPVTVNPLTGQEAGTVENTLIPAGDLPDPATIGVFTYTDDNGVEQTLDPAGGDQMLSETEAATLTFTPAPDFNGVVPTITTTVTDTNGDTSTVTIDITVTPVNDPPTADDETFMVLENTPINIDVLDGDVDPDGDMLTITEVDGQPIMAGETVPVTNGTVTLENDGTLTFTPDMNYNGPIDFTYTIADPSGASTTATVSGEVDPVPMAAMLVADTPEDTPLLVDPTEGQDPPDFAVIQDVRIDSVPLVAEGVLTYTEDGTGNIITVSPGDVLSRDEAQTLTYEPFLDFNGPLANVFDFTLISGNGMGGTIDTPGTYELSVIPVNDPPVADDETFTVDEDGGPVVIDLITGDTDLEDPNDLTVTEINGTPVVPGDTIPVAGGTVLVNNDGTISYTPDPNFNGPAVFEYTVSDPDGGTDTGTVTGFVEPLPEGGDVPATTPEETPISINPLINEDPGTVDFVTIGDASLPDPTTVGVFTYTDDGGNTVTLDPNDATDEVLSPTEAASLIFNPATDFTGTVPPVPFVVTDTNGDEAGGNLLIEVTPINDPPVAQDDTLQATEDTPLNIDIINTLTSDVDNTLDELQITAINGTPVAAGGTVPITNGSVMVNFDGTVTFTPDPDYFGPAVFDYTVSDPDGLSDDGTITLTVDGVPEPLDDAYSVEEDGSVPTPIGDNDDFGDGPATIALDSVPTAAQGTLTYVSGGATITIDPANPPQALTPAEAATLVFTPAPDFDGAVDNIEYTVTDADGDVASATATIDIDPAPDAVDDTLTAIEDTPLPLPLTGNDDLGDGLVSLTIDSIPLATEGVLTYQDQTGDKITVTAGTELTPTEAATLTFAPADDFFGPVTQFTYTIEDNTGDTSTANVDITVNGLPEPQPDVVATDEDTPVDLNITANDDLGDGPATVSLDAVPPTSQGTLTYVSGGVTITVDPANPPVALTAAEAATLNFAPASDFDGAVDQISYTVTDANGDMASTTVTITINPLPDPVADVFATKEDTPLDLPLVDNDDTGDGLATLTIQSVPPSAQGVLTFVDANGVEQTIAAGDVLTPGEAATIKFTPEADFAGSVDQFTYQIEDSNGDVAATTVDITVDATPDVSSDQRQAQENVPLLIDPLANDQDFGDGVDAISIDNIPPATQGTLTYTEDGTGNILTIAAGDELSEAEMNSLTFNPAQDFNGTVDPFDYTVRDLNGDEATATITIGVAASVLADDDSLETPEETPIALNPLDNDDPGGPDAVVVINTVPPASQGVLTFTDANGVAQPVGLGDSLTTELFATLVFTPAAGFQGTVDPIDYLIVDPDGNTDGAFINILVDGIPEAEDDVYSGEEDTPLPLPIIDNDDQGDGPAQVRFEDAPDPSEGVITYTDAGGNTVTVAAGTTLSANEAQSLVFTPAEDFEGAVAPLDYTLIDQDGDEATATITIDIDANPDLTPDVFTVNEDTDLPLPIFTNDDLGDGLQTLTIENIPAANEGVLAYTNAAGQSVTVTAGDDLTPAEAASLTFEPADDFFGPVTRFEYTVTDLDGDIATTTVDITVNGLPELVADLFTTDEDSPVVVNLVANDDLGDGPSTITLDSVPPTTQGALTYTDVNGVVQTVDPANPPAGLTPGEIATLTFTPAPDFDQPVDSIAYTVTDANGDAASTTAQIVINPLPDPIADSFTTDEDTPIALPLVGNDDDGDGLASLTVDTLPDPGLGALTYTNANGAQQTVMAGVPLSPAEATTIVFTPAPDASGVVPPFGYTITDASGDSASTTVSITIDAVPDPVDDVFETPEETPVSINVLADNGGGADDPGDGVATISFDVLPPASQGVLTYVDRNGLTQNVVAGEQLDPAEAVTLVFTPDAAFNGAVNAIPYTLTDTNGDAGVAAIRITVDGIPDVAPDIFIAGPDETIPTNFLTNDPDFGDGLDFVTIDNVPPTGQGVLTYVADGGSAILTVMDGDRLSAAEMATLMFDPDTAFFGAVDPINYTVTDIDGDTASTVANIFVDANTDVEPDDLLTKEDTPIDLNLVANDEIADAASTVTIGAVIPPATEGVLTYLDDTTGAVTTITANDTLSVTELATITFTPAAGFTGQVTDFDYTVTASPAGGGTTDTATVMILVDPVPEAVNDQYTTKEDTIISIPVNANDDNGTGFDNITFNSLPDGATEGEVFFRLGGTGAPTLLTTGTPISAAEAATLFFIPVADFNGPVATFQYELTDLADRDGMQETVTADVEITVDAVPDPVLDERVVDEDTPLDIDIIANDDVGDGLATATINNTPDATIGVLSYVDANGDRQNVVAGDPLTPAEIATLRFTPAPDFDGAIPDISYTITDTNGDQGASILRLTMNPTPDVAPDVFSTKEDTAIAVNPLTNDEVDLGGDRDAARFDLTGPPAAQGVLTYTSGMMVITIGDGATVTGLTADEIATLTFTPAPDFSGPVDPVPYTVTDANGDMASTTITITVDAVPDAVDEAFTVDEDTPLTFSVIGNDDQGDGPATVTFNDIPDPTAGVLTYISDAGVETPVDTATPLSATEAASIIFTPADDFDGVIPPLDYTITDQNGDTDIGTVTLTMNPVPDAVVDILSVKEDQAVDFDPLANDPDQGDGPSTIAVTAPPAAQGVLSYEETPGNRVDIPAGATLAGLTPDQVATFRFTVTPDFDGAIDPIPYTVTDNTGDTADSQIFIAVDPTPDPLPDVLQGEQEVPLDLDLVLNDDTGEGLATLRFDTFPAPAEGVLTVLDGGVRRPVVLGEELSPALLDTLQFAPETGFIGDVTQFTYTITDNSGDEASTTVDIFIDPAPLPASDISAPTENGDAVTIDVVANDQDNPIGDIIDPTTVQIFGTDSPGDQFGVPGEGLWEVDPTTGAITFTPEIGFVGDPTPILYTIVDDDGFRSDPVGVRADYVPLGTDDQALNQPPGPNTIDIVVNDVTGDAVDPTTVQLVGTANPGDDLVVPNEGTWSIDPIFGALTFTPLDGFTDDPTPVQYTIEDSEGNRTDPVNVLLDYAPIATDDLSSNNIPTQAVTLDILANDTTGDSVDPTTVQLVGTANPGDDLVVPNEGTWSIDPATGALTFTPLAGFDDDPTPVQYTVADDEGNLTDPTNATIEYAPLGTDDLSSSNTPGQAVTVDILANDLTGDVVDPTTVQLVGTAKPGDPLVVPGEGTWAIDPTTGALTFTPEAGFNDDPTPVQYTVSDDEGNLTAPTNVTVDYVPIGADDLSSNNTPAEPVIVDILANDLAGDVVDPTTVQLVGTANPGDPLVVPGEGVWTIEPATGVLTFTPEAGFTDDPTPVQYIGADDEGNLIDPINVTVDYAPIATEDLSPNNTPGQPVTVDILANDITGDMVDPTTVQLVGTANPGDPLVVPGEGTWTIDPTTGALTFTPEDGFTSDPTPVQYAVADDEGNTTAPSSVVVDYAPISTEDVSPANEPGAIITIDVLGNDVTGDAVDPTTVQLVGTANPGDPLVVPGEGVWTIDPTSGAITFTPEDGVVTDPAPVQYTVADDEGNLTDPVSVIVDYRADAADDSVADVQPGVPVTIGVLANDIGGDAVDPTTVQLVGTANPGDPLIIPGEGVYTIDPVTGAITYTPEVGFAGSPTPVQYTVADEQGSRSTPATISIGVAFVDNPEDLLRTGQNIDPFDFDEPERELEELRVDPIVRETADFQSPLGSITPLDADFPITSAINSLISLEGTQALPTQGLANFGSLAAPYPITIAVQGVDPSDFFHAIADFNVNIFDKLRANLPSDTEVLSLNILVGFDRAIILMAADTDAGPTVLVAADQKATDASEVDIAAFTPTGDAMPVSHEDGVAVIALTSEDASLHLELDGEDTLDGGVHVDAEGGVSFALQTTQPYSGFSGQVTDIANAKVNEIAQLGAVL